VRMRRAECHTSLIPRLSRSFLQDQRRVFVSEPAGLAAAGLPQCTTGHDEPVFVTFFLVPLLLVRKGQPMLNIKPLTLPATYWIPKWC
jgi:hypothetical protein